MAFYWNFFISSGSLIQAQLSCYPVEPGSIVISIKDGINDKTITDDGDGLLVGDGNGTIDYDHGFIAIDVFAPMPVSGTPVKVDYNLVEGGCADSCGKCATHYIRLDITAAGISGSSSFTISEAWERLFKKIRRDIMPIHVEIKNDESIEYFISSVGSRFDVLAGDTVALDGTGLRPLWDDTSW